MSSYHMLFVSLCKAYGLHSLLDFGNKLSMYKYLYVTERSENTPGRVDSGRVDPGLSWLRGQFDFRLSWPATCGFGQFGQDILSSVLVQPRNTYPGMTEKKCWQGRKKSKQTNYFGGLLIFNPIMMHERLILSSLRCLKLACAALQSRKNPASPFSHYHAFEKKMIIQTHT